MYNIIISILIGLDLLGMLLIMIKNKRIFLAKSSIFLIPMLIILMSIFYVGMEYESTMQHIFGSIFYSLSAITFRDSFSHLKAIFRADNHFVINYYINLLMIGFMSFSAIIDLFFKQAINFFRLLFKSFNATVVITSAEDEDAAILFKSKGRRIAILSEGNKDFEKQLMDNNITYVEGINLKNLKRFSKRGNKYISLLKKYNEITNLITLFKDISDDLYIECDDINESLIEPLIERYFNIFLFNKYKLIGYDFLLNNPLALKIGSSYIDHNTSLLRPNRGISIYMIGFDKANKNIYLELIKNNQYAYLVNDKICAYNVNYHIYANSLSETLELNHKLRKLANNNGYFAPFEPTFSYIVEQIDYKMYDSIKASLNKNNMNIFIISQQSTYIGLDYANKIKGLVKDYDAIFYLRDPHGEIDDRNFIIPFGNENKIMTIDNILNESLFDLAKKRAALYDSSKSPSEVWKGLSRDKRLSNINCIVSITHKLALMGLCISNDKNNSLSRDEYFNIYDNNHEIEYVDNKILYPMYFKRTINNRNSLAFIEHNRWNTEMLVKGYLPMKEEQIYYDLNKNKLIKDDSRLKLHSCITSFDGLDKYYDYAAKKIVEAKNISYNEAYMMVENKKYDYELMDNAYDLIKMIDSKISEFKEEL